jgi:hypothetical protein
MQCLCSSSTIDCSLECNKADGYFMVLGRILLVWNYNSAYALPSIKLWICHSHILVSLLLFLQYKVFQCPFQASSLTSCILLIYLCWSLNSICGALLSLSTLHVFSSSSVSDWFPEMLCCSFNFLWLSDDKSSNFEAHTSSLLMSMFKILEDNCFIFHPAHYPPGVTRAPSQLDQLNDTCLR